MIRPDTPEGTVVYTFNGERGTVHIDASHFVCVKLGNLFVPYICADLFYTLEDAERDHALWLLAQGP